MISQLTYWQTQVVKWKYYCRKHSYLIPPEAGKKKERASSDTQVRAYDTLQIYNVKAMDWNAAWAGINNLTGFQQSPWW